MTEYHRDSKKFVRENCKHCARCDDFDDCSGVYVYLGDELIATGIMPDAEPKRFYFADRCPKFKEMRE